MPPHGLHGFGDLAGGFVFRNQDIEFGKTLSVWKSGFGQEAFGLRQIKAEFLHLRVAFHRRHHARGRLLTGPQHVVDDACPVEGKGEGAPHPHVREGWAGGIDPEIPRGTIRVVADNVRVVFQVVRNPGQRRGIGRVQLSPPEEALLHGIIVDRVETHAVELHVGCVPVVGIPLHLEILAEKITFELEGTIAHQLVLVRPGIHHVVDAAIFLDDMPGHRPPGGVAGNEREMRGGTDQGEFQRGVIKGAGAEFLFLDLAFIKREAVFQQVEHLSVLSPQFFPQHAPVGPDKIMGGEGRAVGPFGVFLQMESPDRFVRVGLPFFGHAGLHILVAVAVFAYQPLIKRKHDVVLGDAVAALEVEEAGFGFVIDQENLFPGSLPGIDGVRAAAGQACRGEHGAKEEQQSKGGHRRGYLWMHRIRCARKILGLCGDGGTFWLATV